MTKIVKIDVEADAMYVGATMYLSQESVVEALRSVASKLEAAGSTEIAPRQFREAARAFAGLEEPPPPPPHPLRPRERHRLFGRRRK